MTVTAHDFTWDVSGGPLLTDRIVELSKASVDGKDYKWDVPVDQTRSLNDRIHYGKVGKVKVDVTAWRGEGRPMASTTITITLVDNSRATEQEGTLAQTGADASGVLIAGLSLAGLAAGVELIRRRMSD